MRSADLATAHDIGRTIADDAIWSEDRCNWLGADVDAPESGHGRPTEIFRALDDSFYGGTAGIGFTLAELFAHTQDDRLRVTAAGALRHALDHASATPGLYTGAIGVALAGARVGRLLGDEAIAGRAHELALESAFGDDEGHSDLMLGAAGTIVGSLALAGLLEDARLIDAARAAGERLLLRAASAQGALSWGTPHDRRARHLTGFSHGAAGIAVALLELHAVTGEERLRDAATRAFAYEQRLFEPRAQNWPDLRNASTAASTGFALFWCHGAPGIALSRLRALELGVRDPAIERDLSRATASTVATLEHALAQGGGGFSLCHGLAGNAEIAREGQRPQPAAAIAELGRTLHGARHDWPCGMLGGPTPSLLVGLAGIAHFYLRLAESSVPSALLIRPQAWARGGQRSERSVIEM